MQIAGNSFARFSAARETSPSAPQAKQASVATYSPAFLIAAIAWRRIDGCLGFTRKLARSRVREILSAKNAPRMVPASIASLPALRRISCPDKTELHSLVCHEGVNTGS